MTEAELKRPLVKLLREIYPNFVIWRVEDATTSGIPDIVITGNKITSYWEVKHGTPHIKVKGVQGLTMTRLARQGFAFFIVYYEKGSDKRTCIVDPKEIKSPIETWNQSTTGFNHNWLVGEVGKIHHVNNDG